MNEQFLIGYVLTQFDSYSGNKTLIILLDEIGSNVFSVLLWHTPVISFYILLSIAIW